MQKSLPFDTNHLFTYSALRATKKILGQGFQAVPKRAELVAV